MADFLETPAFPACPTYGYTAEPMYSTNVTRAASGREVRNRNWSRPLHRFTFSLQRGEEEIVEVLKFFHAVGGRECGFRFRDYNDFKSCDPQDDISPVDQPLVPTTDSPLSYQLTKQYVVGTRTQLREIVKPIATTIRVTNQLGAEQSADRWDLDEATGLLTPNGGFVGTPTAWGGEFDVPVRFDSDALPFQIADKQILMVDFTLTEMRL